MWPLIVRHLPFPPSNLVLAEYRVPLDYLGGTPGYANLSVGRLLAKNTTAKLGSLFVNPVCYNELDSSTVGF